MIGFESTGKETGESSRIVGDQNAFAAAVSELEDCAKRSTIISNDTRTSSRRSKHTRRHIPQPQFLSNLLGIVFGDHSTSISEDFRPILILFVLELCDVPFLQFSNISCRRETETESSDVFAGSALFQHALEITKGAEDILGGQPGNDSKNPTVGLSFNLLSVVQRKSYLCWEPFESVLNNGVCSILLILDCFSSTS